MHFSAVVSVFALAGLADIAFAVPQQKGGNQGANQAANQGANQGGNQAANQNAGNNALALNPANVQQNSNSDGLDATAEPGQAASLKDPANFINFCTGQTLTNGLQVTGGSCNGIPMGQIPSSNKMVSAAMVSPLNGETCAANQPMNFAVRIDNVQAGVFTNPDNTYYAAPQQVKNGVTVGHTHISVQTINGLTDSQPPDAAKFVFFKGINDAGQNGVLSANDTAGLPAGTYRVCSMTSASNHQPVLMPIAQRGPQDDCVKFTVANNAQGGGCSAQGGGNANANAGGNQGQAAQGQGAQGQGALGGKGGKGKQRTRKRFSVREWVA